MAHKRQSRPDSVLDFQVTFFETIERVASLLESGRDATLDAKTLNNLISHDVFIDCFSKVKSPTKSSTCCLPLLFKILIPRVCGGVDVLKLISRYIT